MQTFWTILSTGSRQSVIALGSNPLTYVQDESAVCKKEWVAERTAGSDPGIRFSSGGPISLGP
jgi:hypothetical protein